MFSLCGMMRNMNTTSTIFCNAIAIVTGGIFTLKPNKVPPVSKCASISHLAYIMTYGGGGVSEHGNSSKVIPCD